MSITIGYAQRRPGYETPVEPVTKPRMDWIDLIKGTSVVLVVLMHASLVLPQVAGDSAVADLWSDAGQLLEPLRMPVFFLVSGMLAASAINREWDSNRRRTWGIGYVYVVWTAILLVFTSVVLQWQALGEALVGLPATLFFASSGYWYLFALVAFFGIAYATRSLPPWLVVGAAAAINIARPLTDAFLDSTLEPIHQGSLAPTMAMNLVFFLAGVHFKQLAGQIAHYATVPRVVALGMVLVALGVYRLETPILWGQTLLPLSVGWIVWAIWTAHLATRRQTVQRFGSYLGQRTLPIYVMQFPLLYGATVLLQKTQPDILSNAATQALFPVILTSLIALIALSTHTLVQRNALRYIFTAPDWALDPIGRMRRTAAPRIGSPRASAAETSASPVLPPEPATAGVS